MYLNCHSCYSMRYGTLRPERLAQLAAENGIAELVLTDIHNSSAAFDFVLACKNEGIKPILGMEFRDVQGRLLYVGVARNETGFRELNEFLSRHNLNELPLSPTAPLLNNCFFVYAWNGDVKVDPRKLPDNCFLGIGPMQTNQLYSAVASRYPEKLVVLHPVTFENDVGRNTHRLLRAIEANELLSRMPAESFAGEHEYMMERYEQMSRYSRFPGIIKNTQQLLDGCSFSFDFGTSKNRKTFTGSYYEDYLLLEQEAVKGFEYRYPGNAPEARQRLRKELDIIRKLNFNAYFLITWDMIRFARRRNYAYVGRGSGANSMVAYCLRITDADPMELDLYFERFLNPHRASPPDFDVDFIWNERDEVIRYLFERYGQKYTALLATYNTFQGRSALRELGKVFGLPKPEIDALTELRDPSKEAGRDKITRLIWRYGQRIKDLPNHLSIHAGGVLISEEPICSYTALDHPPKGFPITHFDMMVAEDIGLHKHDVLSQRGLGHIRDAAKLIRERHGLSIDLHDSKKFKEDSKARKILREGKAMGCFYIESPAMRMLLSKLHCDDFITLVAASSIIRPGVAKSGMMREYIHRYHNPDSWKPLHPRMGELLQETYGVMVYQEDVIKVAHHFAGLDLAESDVLRRGMSGKYRSKKEFQRVVDRFFECCKQRGYTDALSKEVWRQIESFSGYSFSKAHSASFAIESFQSLWLKAHYPHEFHTAVINNYGGFYRTEFYVHEARRWGAEVAAPCVNYSLHDARLIDNCIFLGLGLVKALENKLILRLIEEREKHGPYQSLEDFVNRTQPGREQLQVLIRIGALRFTGRARKTLLWEAFALLSKGNAPKTEAPRLFSAPRRKFSLPVFDENPLERAFDEIELLGFPLVSPFELLPEGRNTGLPAAKMRAYVGKKVEMLGYLVCTKDVRTMPKRHLMHFGTFIDASGDFFDSIHFPKEASRYPFLGRGFYRLRGRISTDFDYPSIEVDFMEKVPTRSREAEAEKNLSLKAGKVVER